MLRYRTDERLPDVVAPPAVSVCVLGDDFGGAWAQVDGRAEVLHMPEAEDALVDYDRCIAGEHPDGGSTVPRCGCRVSRPDPRPAGATDSRRVAGGECATRGRGVAGP